ncbi:MAG: hypothetical protein J2P32_15300, partial [Actinobacteria bacterium]|nr:hypothetical protein [Actinomycetota bacterium]
MVRYLLFLLGSLSVNAPGRRQPAEQLSELRTAQPAGAWRSAGTWQGRGSPGPLGSVRADPDDRPGDGTWPGGAPGGAGGGTPGGHP